MTRFELPTTMSARSGRSVQSRWENAPKVFVAAILVAAAIAGCGDSAPAETGPLAIYRGEWNGDDALVEGTVRLAGECFVIDAGPQTYLLGFARDGTSWDAASETAKAKGRDWSAGSKAGVGGSGGRNATEVDWLVPPHESCLSLQTWFVNE
jgi:hypothetical protein